MVTPPEKMSFSKAVLLLVLGTYFLGLFLGMFVVVRILLITPEYSVQAFMALLSYIGAPTGVALAFYSWKAKAENCIKIKGSLGRDDDDDDGGGQDGQDV